MQNKQLLYIGQTDRGLKARFNERHRYIKSNPKAAYAIDILNNRHEYGTAEETLALLRSRKKGTRMNCLGAFCMQTFHQHKILIKEQQVNDINPLYESAYTSHIL